jgi:hypothetical protein
LKSTVGQSLIIISLNSFKKEKKKKNIKWPLDTFLFTFKKKVLITNFIFLELSRKENIFKNNIGWSLDTFSCTFKTKVLGNHPILFSSSYQKNKK